MISLYIPINSFSEAQTEMTRIRNAAQEKGVTIVDLVPSGSFGACEGEQAILSAISAGGQDPTTCIKGTISDKLHLWE